MTSSVLPRTHGLAYYVWKLLRVSARISLKSLLRARRGRKLGVILLALLAIGLIAAVFIGSLLALRFLASPQFEALPDADRLLGSIPTIILTASFVTTLLFSFGLLLQGLYLSGDMEFLLTTPVPLRALFIAKMIQATLPNVLLVCLFAIPLLIGLGAAQGYALPYYPLAVIELIGAMLAGAGIASLLVMGIVRLFPARLVAEVLGAIGGILALVLSQIGNFGGRFRFTPGQTSNALRLLTNTDTPWSPFSWAGSGLTELGRGTWLTGTGLALLALALTGFVFIATLAAAERYYFSGWTRLQSGSHRKKVTRRVGAPALRPSRALWLDRLLPRATRGIIVKDGLALRRDVRSLSQLVSPLILGLIYAIAFIGSGGRAPAGRGEAPEWFMTGLDAVWLYGSTAIAVFVGWSLMSRLALMAFSHEGRQYWIIKAAPIGVNELLAGKFIVAFLPTLLLGWAFMLVMAVLQRSPGALAFGLPVVGLMTAGGTGIHLAFGASATNLNWDTPRQMVSTTAGCTSSIASLVYFGISAGLFFIPPITFALLGWPQAGGQAMGLGLGGLLSVACAIIPPVLVRGRVAQLGEA